MDEARSKKNVEVIQDKMQEIMANCTELEDAVIVLNWKADEVKDGLQLPASLVFSNRKDQSTFHIQTAQLCNLMLDTVRSMYDRIVGTLLTINNELSSEMQKHNDGEAAAGPTLVD